MKRIMCVDQNRSQVRRDECKECLLVLCWRSKPLKIIDSTFEGYFFYLWINRCKNNLYFRRSSFSRSSHIETFQWFDQCKARSFKARHHTSYDFVTSAAFATVDARKWVETTSTIRQRFDFGSEQRHGYCVGDVVFAIFTSWTKKHSQREKKWVSSPSSQGKE